MTEAPPTRSTGLPNTPERVDWQAGVFRQDEGGRLRGRLRSIDAAAGWGTPPSAPPEGPT